jgi:hypothetical protein
VGTKICHVYLVSTYENQPADMTNVGIYCSWKYVLNTTIDQPPTNGLVMQDDIEAYLPWESDEQYEEVETSNADVLMDD